MVLEVNSTKLQCTADELRQSNTLAESLSNMLRGIFSPVRSMPDLADEEEGTDED